MIGSVMVTLVMRLVLITSTTMTKKTIVYSISVQQHFAALVLGVFGDKQDHKRSAMSTTASSNLIS